MDWLGLENKAVLVTGAASGIGKAVSEGLLESGANVIACDINKEKPEFNFEDEKNLLYKVCDVTIRQEVREAIADGVKKYGCLDAIVNNAGINIPRLLVDPKKEESELALLFFIFFSPVKYFLSGAIPALINSSESSSFGISGNDFNTV